MIDAFAIVDRLSTYTLGGLMAIILIGSYFRIWVWGSVVTDLRAEFAQRQVDFDQRLAHAELARQRWETVATRVMGLAEIMTNGKS